MLENLTLQVNGGTHHLEIDPQTPLLNVLREELGLAGPKYGCGSEQCGACKVLIDGQDVPSCQLPVAQAAGLPIMTVEGLGSAENPHPLQEAFIEAQALQCGYCAAGMIIAAQGLLHRTRYPTDQQIREALADNLCRCGVYDRVRRAIKLRIGRPDAQPPYAVIAPPALPPPPPSAGLPRSLQRFPELDSWIRINNDETITIFSGKVEIGQGIKTAVAQIAAEELDVALERIRVVTADTAQAPDEGITAGSMSVQTSGAALRVAAAEARQLLLTLAYEELEAETAAAALVVQDGRITDPATGRQTSYWSLMGGRRFGRRIQGHAPVKAAETHQTVGTAAPRLDIPAKVTGAPSFVQDLQLPGMVHGRVVRPPNYHARLKAADETAARGMPGVLAVVRDGRFLGIIAETGAQADQAAEVLRAAATWESERELPPMAHLPETLRGSEQSTASLVVDGTAGPDPIPAPPPLAGTQQHAQTYFRPYQMHASLSPSAAAAQLVAGELIIWSHSQGIPLLPQSIGQVLGMDPARIRAIHVEGSGCYGHNGADDAALDAALLARALPGRPVLVQWSRADEHGWEPYGSAMVMKLEAGVDERGGISGWRHTVWSFPHTARPRPDEGSSGLLGAWHLARPWEPPQPRVIHATHFGDYRNADPIYALPNKQIVTQLNPDSPLRTSSLRGLGAYANIFAIESFMDELAQVAGKDPLQFRLQHLTDARARAVLRAAAEHAGWEERPYPAGGGRGRGLAFAQYKNQQCYAAIVVDVIVDPETGAIRLEEVWIAADAGQIINPDGLSNQLEGGFMQAASWTLYEEVTWEAGGITSRDWDSYPILRFPAAPRIRTVLLDRPNHPPLGSGEAAQGPAGAAIANAIFDAAGVRLTKLPLTAAKLQQARAGITK